MNKENIRGIRDILPETASKIRYLEDKLVSIVSEFGFREIILPTFEDITLFRRSVGSTTDIIQKQMYELTDKKGRKFALRPEGTAGVVRAYIQNNLKNLYALKRFYYFGPMFRYERPQKGRYREFYQFGLEVFGELSPISDVLILFIANRFFKSVGIFPTLFINSVGCYKCRGSYHVELIKFLEDKRDYLCEDCKVRLEINPLRVLDCKIDREMASQVPSILNYICESCKENYNQIKCLLEKQQISFVEDRSLVRGLDYYTNFVFEFKTSFLNAAQNTICAGGRYDSLIKDFGAEDTPALGCAFGIDRICDLIDTVGMQEKRKKIGIVLTDGKYASDALSLVDELENCIIVGPFSNRSLKSQLRLCNNENCDKVLLVGQEVETGKIVIRDFKDNSQKIIEISNLNNEL